MKNYIIPVEWTMVKNINIAANSLEEAKELAGFASFEKWNIFGRFFQNQ